MTLRFTHNLPAPAPSPHANGDTGWGTWVPSMWHALADPEGTVPWPARLDTDSQEAIAWWVPPVELLAYSLAWPRLDIGLRWWTEAGRPTRDDSRLAMLDQMLGPHLDELCAWIWTKSYARDLETSIADATSTVVPDAERVTLEDSWLQRVLEMSNGRASPFTGDGDPLHLSTHVTNAVSDWEEPKAAPARLITGSKTRRSAVLVTDRYTGWYRELATLGATLPDLAGDRSWRIEVVCAPVGHLGTFRRSRVTGRWFAGRHRFHVKGWPSI